MGQIRVLDKGQKGGQLGGLLNTHAAGLADRQERYIIQGAGGYTCTYMWM